MHSATIVFSAPSAASGNRQMLLINAPWSCSDLSESWSTSKPSVGFCVCLVSFRLFGPVYVFLRPVSFPVETCDEVLVCDIRFLPHSGCYPQ
jgi:hypothetical protein